MSKIVLVSGATGQQGGSVVQALLKDGHQVVGITRNIESPKAIALKEQGVELVSADFTDQESLVKIMNNVDTVFSMTTPFEAGLEAEVNQGITMANAAKEAGVKHFIFNSVSDADRDTGIPHFDSKYHVEKHLETLGLNYTIVAPVYFMENLLMPHVLDAIRNQGVLRMAMPNNVPLQQIAVEDIGSFVSMMVNDREKVFGKRMNIAGDELTGDEAAEVLTEVLGKEIRYEGISSDFLRAQSEDLAKMFDWFIETGYSAKLKWAKTHKLLTFKDWIKKQDWTKLG